MRKRNSLAVMAIVWWAAFCTASRPYHLEHPVEVVYDPTSLAYIELDEYGDLWANKGEQLAAAVKLIETANRNPEGAIVVTYVHGWAHNADPGRPDDPDPKETNLALFKTVLGHLTVEENETAYKDNRPRRSIAGVFIAWRGRQLWPIDYYQRDSAAGRVAGSATTEALVAINRIAKSRAKDPNGASRQLSAAVDVTCPAPPRIRLAFRGGESGCTRETVCDGSLLCRLGERIDFSLADGPLAGCERVRWNFGDGSTDDRIAPSHTYLRGASAV